MKIKLTASELETVASNNGLSRYLTSLSRGRPFTPRSWLYEEVEPDNVLQQWKNVLDTLWSGNQFEKNVYLFDTVQIAKWGAQGGVEPLDELESELTKSFLKPIPLEIENDSLWTLAKTIVTRRYTDLTGLKRLRPRSYRHVIENMSLRDTLASNSGWPLFARRKKQVVIEASIADALSGKWKEYPAIVLFRNYNQKTRAVWMYPFSTNLVEGSFTQPLQEALIASGREFNAPWHGFNSVRAVISRHYSANRTLAASDFSETDAHFTIDATLEVFDVIHWCFQANYWKALSESMVNINKIPLVIGPDSKLIGYHGVSSGSNWTSIIETIFDEVLAEYYSLLYTESYIGTYGVGDDTAWSGDKFDECFSSQLAEVGKRAGQEIKQEKTTNHPDFVVSLQRLFQRGYNVSDSDLLVRGVYPTIRALKSAVYPEKYHDPKSWNADLFCTRTYMILENCVDHPLFEQFVKFVVRGNRHLIPFAKKSKQELDKILRKSRALSAFNPTYNQEKLGSSLSNFESIKFAGNLS